MIPTYCWACAQKLPIAFTVCRQDHIWRQDAGGSYVVATPPYFQCPCGQKYQFEEEREVGEKDIKEVLMLLLAYYEMRKPFGDYAVTKALDVRANHVLQRLMPDAFREREEVGLKDELQP